MGATLEGTVELIDGMAFTARTSEGHQLVVDATAAAGGHGAGPLPMELLLLGLGGCTGMDVISILRKMRQDVTGYRITLHGERADEHPKVFTDIVVVHDVSGRNLNPEHVRRAIELSATRYCSAAAMLGKVARIDERFHIRDEATGQELTGSLMADPIPSTPASMEYTGAV
jgi:putative redox protein